MGVINAEVSLWEYVCSFNAIAVCMGVPTWEKTLKALNEDTNN